MIKPMCDVINSPSTAWLSTNCLSPLLFTQPIVVSHHHMILNITFLSSIKTLDSVPGYNEVIFHQDCFTLNSIVY